MYLRHCSGSIKVLDKIHAFRAEYKWEQTGLWVNYSAVTSLKVKTNISSCKPLGNGFTHSPGSQVHNFHRRPFEVPPLTWNQEKNNTIKTYPLNYEQKYCSMTFTIEWNLRLCGDSWHGLYYTLCGLWWQHSSHAQRNCLQSCPK